MGVLLLNATYEPIRVISVRRAVVLVLAQKAEMLEAKPGRFRSADDSIPIPAVVKLKYFVKIPYRAKLPLNRRNVLIRDKYACQYCTKTADTIDHVMPRARGGRHEWTNVVAACRACNSKKDDKLLKEMGWSLPRRPVAPTGTYWLILGVQNPDPAWDTYLGVVATT